MQQKTPESLNYYSAAGLSKVLGGKPSSPTIIKMIKRGLLEATLIKIGGKSGKRTRYLISGMAAGKVFTDFEG